MTEKLLQYIWQFQYFNKSHLQTCKGEELIVLNPGILNKDQGPDFTNARVKIGATIMAGSIELHLKLSDWIKHQHEADPNYKNVILHVVFHKDVSLDGYIPVLELQSLVPKFMLHKYEELMSSVSFIACSASIKGVKEITWLSWKERLLAERLTRKSNRILSLVDQNTRHWEETFWWLLARNFGVKVNSDAFEAIAVSLPLTVLARHKNSIHQLEALLLGQANLLHAEQPDAYTILLQKEYAFLKKKYNLKEIQLPVHFLRMRPSNFPTVRLAQLAQLIHSSQHLFSKIVETERIEQVSTLLNVTANDYWHYHYRLSEDSSYMPKNIGGGMINNLIINTLAPVLFAYGLYHDNEKYNAKALSWLDQIGAEANSITANFKKLAVFQKSAFDSQALLELKNEYCNKKRCLECSVGNYILKGNLKSTTPN